MRAVLKQHAVEMALRVMQLQLDAALIVEVRGRAIRRAGFDGPIGCVVGYRYRGHDRAGARLRSAKRHRVAGVDCEYNLGRHVRREHHFGAVCRDQPVHIAARSKRVLRDLTFISNVCAGPGAGAVCARANPAKPTTIIVAPSRTDFRGERGLLIIKLCRAQPLQHSARLGQRH
jgi:hypothetical protein